VDEPLTYRGRRITDADLLWLRARIAAEPGLSRRALSLAVCDAWQWQQPNGLPCDAICRGLLLWLHRGGHLVLPPARWGTRKPWRPRTSAPPVLIDTTPITGALRDLRPLAIHQVRRTPDEGLCNSLLAQHHYLGHRNTVDAVPFCFTSSTH